jgi:Na+-driven multidrug efflux pump
VQAGESGSLPEFLLQFLSRLRPRKRYNRGCRDKSVAARVIAFGSEYLRIVSFNFISTGIVFTTSSVFQGIGNTLPPLLSSLTRLILFAVPAVLISRTPGFEIRQVWYLSVASIVFQMRVNLLLLRHELWKRLRFGEPENFIPASATAS